ncbi:MAG TPA: mevalonate kinase [Gammaproteobacteria bacterium]|nr:mevalonate kinase [Gammaproteobacteria bacterium]
MRRLTAQAPAKLILSGEHAVLYDQPAIAMAVNRYTTTTTTWRDTPHIHFKFLDLAYAKSHTCAALRRLAMNLQNDYNSFLEGKCSIRKVLKRPFQLLQYSVSNLLDSLNVTLPCGVEIAVDSTIPIGCGMGSSAAAVLSTLYSVTNFLDYKWQRADYLSFSKSIENLQHGRSSGLDLHLSTYGGCVLFKDGEVQARPVPQMPMYIVNTGKPTSSTGECVSAVAPLFKDQGLANEFGNVTRNIDQAINQNDLHDFKRGIKDNHALLQRIGVVPAKVSKFIHAIEQYGGAAKVCGAGAVSGKNAGIVLIVADPEIKDLVKMHGYSLQTIQVDPYGTRII